MLMRAHDRRIDAEQPPDVVYLPVETTGSLRGCEHALVGAVFGPATMPFPRGLPWTEFGRQIAPRSSGSEPPTDPFQSASMLTPRPPASTHARRHKGLQNRPQLITDHTRTNHDPSMAKPTPQI